MQPWTSLSELGQVLGPRVQGSCITRGTELEGRLPLQPLPGLKAGIHVSTFSFLSTVMPVGASTLMATWHSWGRVGTNAAPVKLHQTSDGSRAIASVSQRPLLPAHWEENPFEVLTSWKEVRLLSLTGDLPWSHSLYPDALTWVGLEGGGKRAHEMVFLLQGQSCGKGWENPSSGFGSPITSLGTWEKSLHLRVSVCLSMK